jgi:hypothetical protein
MLGFANGFRHAGAELNVYMGPVFIELISLVMLPVTVPRIQAIQVAKWTPERMVYITDSGIVAIYCNSTLVLPNPLCFYLVSSDRPSHFTPFTHHSDGLR